MRLAWHVASPTASVSCGCCFWNENSTSMGSGINICTGAELGALLLKLQSIIKPQTPPGPSDKPRAAATGQHSARPLFPLGSRTSLPQDWAAGGPWTLTRAA